MPRALDYTPSPAELDRLAEREGLVVYPAPPDGTGRKSVPLWDLTTGDWTKPLPPSTIEMYLRKWGFQCTDCNTFSSRQNLTSHFESKRRLGEIHRDAVVETGVDPQRGSYFCCSACGSRNDSRLKVQSHIQENHALIGTHQEVGYRQVRPFLLAPPTPSVTAQPVPAVFKPPVTEQQHGYRRKRKHPPNPPRAHGAVGAGRMAPD